MPVPRCDRDAEWRLGKGSFPFAVSTPTPEVLKPVASFKIGPGAAHGGLQLSFGGGHLSIGGVGANWRATSGDWLFIPQASDI